MDLNGQQAVEQQRETQKIQIYSTSTTGVSPFWRGLSLSISISLSSRRAVPHISH